MYTALLFPGQGSQESGMGRDSAEADRDIMELWKKAERISGVALREIYWEGDAASMADTRYLQPGLTVVNLSLWRLLSKKITPVAAAGHSLGEFSALAAAGVLPVDTILELVSLRGKLMAQADPEGKGGMAAMLRLTLEQAEACVAEACSVSGKTLVIANYNTPGQYVAAGDKEGIECLQGVVKAIKGRTMNLPVSGAFHSPLMEEAAKEFIKAVDGIKKTDWNTAKFPVYCNAIARPETDAEAIKGFMKRQMTSPVRWIETIAGQWDNGIRRFVECGPKGVLGRMIAPILQEHAEARAACTEEAVAWTIASAGNLEQVEALSI